MGKRVSRLHRSPVGGRAKPDPSRERPPGDPPAAAGAPLRAASDGRRVRERILTTAIWVSFGLHLVLLLALPGPGGVEAAASPSVTLQLRSPSVEPMPTTEPLPTEEEGSPKAPEDAEPAPPPDEADEAMEADEGAEEPAEPPPSSPVEPDRDGESATEAVVEPLSSHPATDDAARIEALLERTRTALSGPDPRERYLVVEVFNRVKQALDQAHDASPLHRRLGEVDPSRKTCLLSFRIDGDGYIFDLGLRTPPGRASALDLEALHAAIYAINPLPAPPPSLETPIERTFEFTFP
ncbi:MAG: hypothetical protein ACYTGJ_09575 [Planctomycetota bacterium]